MYVAEWHNLRNAFGWACQIDDADAAFRLLQACFWWSASRLRFELADWCTAAVALPSAADHPLRPLALGVLGYIELFRGRPEAAERSFESALSDEQRLDVEDRFLPGWRWLYWLIRGDWAEAERQLAESARRARAQGDAYLEVCITVVYAGHLAALHQSRAIDVFDLPAAMQRVRGAVDEAERFGNPQLLLMALAYCGATLVPDDPGASVPLLERALEMSVELDIQILDSYARAHLAAAHGALGRADRALAMMAEAISRDARRGAWLNVSTSLDQTPLVLAAAGFEELAVTILGHCLPETSDQLTPLSRAQAQLDEQLRERLTASEFDRLLEQGRQLEAADAARQVVAAAQQMLDGQ
jgi:tetratricopeptide (TPR) repeat protein